MHRPTAKLAFDKIAATGTKKGNLLILHGLFGSKANFRSLAKRPEMSAERDVYLLDLRNHGESQHLDSNRVEDMAQDIERFMDDHGLERSVLLGHSMGGKTAIQAALNLQDRAEGLIVGDSGPFDYLQFTLNNTGILELMGSLDMSKFSHRDEVHRVFMDHLNGNKLVADFLMTNVVHDENNKLKWRINVPALIKGYPEFSSHVPKKSQIYTGPTTVLYGTRSEYMPKERFPEFKQWFPKLNLETDFKPINGGHWIHFADPEAFLKYVNNFLKSLGK